MAGGQHEHAADVHTADARTAGARTADVHAADLPVRDLAVRLRTRGLRVTLQREQVLQAVRRLGHATPEQIGDAVPGVDPATVYRTLDLLEELGLVNHTHLGHGAASYRPAGDEHIHVICHACGRVLDVDPSLAEDLARRLQAGNGFVLDRSHFTVFGRCADCVQAAEQTPSDPR